MTPLVHPGPVFEFREALTHTGVDRNQLTRWTDVHIIEPEGGGGKGSRRYYTMRHLVQIAVCDRLHRLGSAESTMRKAVRVLEYHWLNGGPAVAFQMSREVLWLSINPRYVHGRDGEDARIDFTNEFAVTTKSRYAPRLTLTSYLQVGADIRDGYFGIAINLIPIVEDLEKRTGEKLT